MLENQRFIDVINFLKSEGLVYNDVDFSQKVGKARSYVSEVKNGKRPISDIFVHSITEAFPIIQSDWLLTGEGSMLKSEAKPAVAEAVVSSPAPLVFGDIVLPPPIDGELVAYDEESYQAAIKKYGSCHLVPEYSVEFRGGDRGAVLDSNYLVGHWMIPNAPRGAFIITMVGRSMEPLLQAGARLLLAPYSFSPEYPNSIKFGEVFGVVVRGEEPDEPHEAYIKIIRKHPEREERKRFWIARSVNEELFDDFDIPIHRVTHLYRVITSLNNIWGY